MKTTFKLTKELRNQYYGPFEFAQDFPDEKACEDKILKTKYPSGYKCEHCNHDKFHRLVSQKAKRHRLIICSNCKKQESITSNTIFYGTKQPLRNWFYAIFRITQNKTGISAYQLSKDLKIAHSSAHLMLHKIRYQMTENAILYQIGGENSIVESDEIEIGGEKSPKQSVLVLLEKKGNKLGRIRFAPIPDQKIKTIESALICQVAKGTTLHTDGKKGNLNLKLKNHKRIKDIIQVAHWEEDYSYEFLKDLDKIVGNLKNWYRGIYHSISHRNVSYYLNEFAYRFNRRRSEVNIFEKLLNRSIVKATILTQKKFFQIGQFLPLAA